LRNFVDRGCSSREDIKNINNLYNDLKRELEKNKDYNEEKNCDNDTN